MFTGIVRALGRVEALDRAERQARLVVAAPDGFPAKPSDSVCVNGVCLTVARRDGDAMAFDVIFETLDRTALGELGPGEEVNLEPSLAVGDPMGGHFVLGHVDGVGRILEKEAIGDGARITVEADPTVCAMLVPKGCVALDGVSLTLISVERDRFEIGLVPFTLRETTLGRKGPGRPVNVEVDVLARYVKALAGNRRGGGVDMDLLRRAGFVR